MYVCICVYVTHICILKITIPPRMSNGRIIWFDFIREILCKQKEVSFLGALRLHGFQVQKPIKAHFLSKNGNGPLPTRSFPVNTGEQKRTTIATVEWIQSRSMVVHSTRSF